MRLEVSIASPSMIRFNEHEQNDPMNSRVGLCIAMYGYEWPTTAMHSCVGLRIAVYGCV